MNNNKSSRLGIFLQQENALKALLCTHVRVRLQCSFLYYPGGVTL